jgi:hypothetical protein
MPHSTANEPETASQSDGSTCSALGSSTASPTRSSQPAAPRSDLTGRSFVRELRLVADDGGRLRAFIATDDPTPVAQAD